MDAVRKIKDLRLRERTENVECGGSHIAGTEYQSPKHKSEQILEKESILQKIFHFC